MEQYAWETRFLDLFDRSLDRYRSGEQDLDAYFDANDLEFLHTIGYKPREFFDFVEDYGDGQDPSPAAAVLIASARRDYLHVVQQGRRSSHEITPEELPPKDEEFGGVRWLPRIIMKAEGKLRGELHPDIMFSCGGDRAFLREHDIHPADFLRVVWAADGDREKVLEYVRLPRP